MPEPPNALTGCPTDRQLDEYVDRTSMLDLDAGMARGDLGRHLASCPICTRRLDEIRGGNQLIVELARAGATRTIGDSPAPDSAASSSPPVVPGYEIQTEIHRGGQGVVWQAIQLATKRRVALKVLLQGSFASVKQQRRFEREIDLVASLRHPNIVTIYDSGTTPDGCLYYAMEYVDGLPLNAHMQKLHGPEASDDPEVIRNALRLFAKVCDAVNYAHQHGVIHRDLKPGNICIDSAGEPQVLDFGLAKDTDPDHVGESGHITVTGEFMGTLAYASPEQTQADPSQIDIRTDVYALGVVLYEMLTTRLPYQVSGTIAEVLKSIVETEPEPPSSWYRRFSRTGTRDGFMPYRVDDEVETIVLKALSKDKARRYQTAEQLKQDIERYLNDEPIDAKRDSTWYRFHKKVHRHRAKVTVAAVFTLVLAGAGINAFISNRVNAHLQQIRQVWDGKLMSLMLALDGYEAKDRHPLLIKLLDRYAEELESIPPEVPVVEAKFRHVLGGLYKRHALYDKAELHLLRSIELYESVPEDLRQRLAANIHELAAVHYKKGEYDQAEPLYLEALDKRRALLGPDHVDIAQTLTHLATVRQRQLRFDEALPMFKEAVEMKRRAKGNDLPVPFAGLMNTATCLTEMGRYADAEQWYRRSLAINDEFKGPDHPRTAMVKTALARCLTRLGKHDEAERLLDAALAVKDTLPNPNHPTIANAHHYLAELHFARGEHMAAEEACRQGLTLRRASLPAGHRRIAESLTLLGMILTGDGRAAEAELVLREAVDAAGVTLVPKHYLIAEARSILGACLTALGRYQEAEPLLIDALERIVDVLGEAHPLAVAARDRIVRHYETRAMPARASAYRTGGTESP